jgi:hypothetical protein
VLHTPTSSGPLKAFANAGTPQPPRDHVASPSPVQSTSQRDGRGEQREDTGRLNDTSRSPPTTRDRDRQRDRHQIPTNNQNHQPLRRSPRHSPRESEQALLAFLQVTAQQPEYWNDQVGDLLDIAAARVQQAALHDDSSDSDC